MDVDCSVSERIRVEVGKQESRHALHVLLLLATQFEEGFPRLIVEWEFRGILEVQMSLI